MTSKTQMKKLEDIPKRSPFEVPEGYFDKLPAVIQARVAQKENSWAWNWSWGLSLRVAFPIVVLAVAGFFWFRGTAPHVQLDLQQELAQFQPQQLQEYIDANDVLDDSDVNTDELVESARWTRKDVDQLEKSVYSPYGTSQQDVQKILDEYDNEL